ncbi:hypothetical protein [Amycolatopsis kentuckyensis]|uniref:hypothetical protein n=1 Tax=Amycolatopsis kentuckyensis TaxID=218823 RepID=UPI0011777869|nr:hypothetical protein [Amycolatopsis kentuckyensis]
MDGVTGFWLSLLLAVPIGIGVNLATPKFQALIARRSEKAKLRLETQNAALNERVRSFAADSTEYITYLISATLQITVITAIAGLVGGVLVLGGNIAENVASRIGYVAGVFLVAIGQLVSLIGVIASFTIARNTLKMANRVKEKRRKMKIERKVTSDI